MKNGPQGIGIESIFSCIIVSTKQVVFSAKCQWTDGVFHQVIRSVIDTTIKNGQNVWHALNCEAEIAE